MHTITLIEKIKETAKRYRIYVDGQDVLTIHEDVLVKYGLHKGMTIQPEQLIEWARADEYGKVRQAVFRYLRYRARSVQEVRSYLAQKDWDSTICEEILQECVEQGYLDDQVFAKAWVKERNERKGYGKLRLRQELKAKGVSSLDIEAALRDIDEEEERQKATELAERRYLRIQDQPWSTIERRIGQYLLRRGYSSSMVYSILNQIRSRRMDEEL